MSTSETGSVSVRRRCALIVMTAALLFSLVPALLTIPQLNRPAGAAPAMSKGDRIDGPPRGSVEEVMAFARSHGAGRLPELEAYLREVYRLAPLVGIDPAVVVVQSAIETGNWTHSYWTYYLNPAGIGIETGGEISYSWSSGADAARFQIALLYIYVHGSIPEHHILRPYLVLGPGHDGPTEMGYVGCCKEINDLSTRWAVDPHYGQHFEVRSRSLFPDGLRSLLSTEQIPQALRANAGANPLRAVDGDLDTSWAVIGKDAPPPGAYLQIDLGAPIRLDTISWAFRATGYADQLRIRISEDGVNYETILFTGNAPAKVWQSLSTDRVARYVRFNVDNPNGKMAIGYIGEVAFHGVPPGATYTSPPPQAIAIPSASGGSSGVTYTGNVRDGNLNTDWRTTGVPAPDRSFVYVDLGAPVPISAIEWVFSQTGGAPELRIDVSDDKKSWSNVGIAGNAPARSWQRLETSVTARYVRWYFVNTTGVPVLGYLAEVRVTTLVPSATPTPEPEPTPAPLTPVSSGGSSGVTYTGGVRDGNLATDWRTLGNPAPERSFVYIDLGAPTAIGALEWVFNQTGGAPQLRLDVSDDKKSWSNIGVAGDAPAGEWQRLETNVTARYVRWYFVNTTGVPVLGYLAEVRIESWVEPVAAPEPTETPTEESSPEASPTEIPPEEPSPTETPGPGAPPIDASALPQTPPLPMVAATGSAGDAFAAIDGAPATQWQAAGPHGWTQIDLGAQFAISSIAWLVSDAACAANLTLGVSLDGETWPLAVGAPQATAWSWMRVQMSATGRYIRWSFGGGSDTIGCLAEVAVWGSEISPADTEPAESTADETAIDEAPIDGPSEEAVESPPGAPEAPAEGPFEAPVEEPGDPPVEETRPETEDAPPPESPSTPD